MSIVLNEKKYAEHVIKTGEIAKNPATTLYLLSRYYRQCENYKIKEIQIALNEFMKKYYPNYNSALWENLIECAAKKSLKYKLREIDSIEITQSELDTIKLLDNIIYEKLLFVLLCYTKLYNKYSGKDYNWANCSIPDLFRNARVTVKKRDDKYRILNRIKNLNILSVVDNDGVISQTSLISFSLDNTNTNIKLNFVDNEGEPELIIDDFRELGYEYLLYLGENYARCETCGILYKQNKNKTNKYCVRHRGYQKKDIKYIKCVDCDKEFEVDARNMTKTRCDECQHEIDKEKTRLRVKKYRNKTNV